MLAGGLDVHQAWHSVSQSVEIIEAKRNANAPGESDQVNHRVGGPADGSIRADRIVECAAGENLRDAQVILDHLNYPPTSHLRERAAPGIDRGNGGIPWQTHAQCLDHARHGGSRAHGHAMSLRTVHATFRFEEFFTPHLTAAYLLRHLPDADLILEVVAAKELVEIERREWTYRDGRQPPDLHGRTVLLVDDGLATGATMRAAVAALRQRGVAKIVVAVPVGAPETCREFEEEVDETICAITPESFWAVGQFYEDFSQTTDDEVRELLAAAAREFKSPNE